MYTLTPWYLLRTLTLTNLITIVGEMLLIKLTPYQSYNSDDFKLIIDELDDMNTHIERDVDGITVREETVAAYVHEMTMLGDFNHPRLWALIGVYHENLYYVLKDISSGTIKNDITALIFAEIPEQASELLRTHPVYQEDIKATVEDDSEPESIAEIMTMDPLDYIFGDVGSVLAQLCGDFVEIPLKYVEVIRAALSIKPGAD